MIFGLLLLGLVAFVGLAIIVLVSYIVNGGVL